MPLFLLDRDGVVVVNQPTNVKTPDQLALRPGAAEAIARLNGAGFDVAICTNQPEVARGVLSRAQLDHVHEGLRRCWAPAAPRSSRFCAVPATESARG